MLLSLCVIFVVVGLCVVMAFMDELPMVVFGFLLVVLGTAFGLASCAEDAAHKHGFPDKAPVTEVTQ